MSHLITTLGRLSADEVGMILPHEHIFVDLRPLETPGFAQADTNDVVALMKPELDRAQAAGVTALVECTPVGVGRRADILKAVSDATRFPLIIPTGIYREPWVPDWAHDATEDELARWMQRELEEQIDGADVQAGWIKLSAGDDGLTSSETKILRAAARAGRATQAVIGSHTIKGRVVLEQLDILEDMGYIPQRFIWIHAQAEEDIGLQMAAAERGAWIEYDWIGLADALPDTFYLERIQTMGEAGFQDQLLLSHDRGGYDPAQIKGGTPLPFTYLTDTFIPQLRSIGFTDNQINQLTCDNPFHAFAR